MTKDPILRKKAIITVIKQRHTSTETDKQSFQNLGKSKKNSLNDSILFTIFFNLGKYFLDMA